MPSNVRTFYILTVTQVLSLIGSRMTALAIGIWLFAETGDSTPVLLAGFFTALPRAVAGGFAGVFADRWNRRQMLLWTDAGQAAGTLLLLLSFASGEFRLWHLYTIALAQGSLGMFQQPAMDASITMLIPDAQRDRANTVYQLTGPVASVIAPVVTGLLYAVVGVVGVIVVDLATFSVAVAALALVRIPQPPRGIPAQGVSAAAAFWHDLRLGLRFLAERRVLLLLMIYAALLNFLMAGPMALSTPYIITLTGSERLLGVLLGLMNVGIVVGGVAVFVWGGTRPRIHGIMLGLLFRAVWLVVYGTARDPILLGVALFFIYSPNTLVDASFMSILQVKVPPEMQGRVFALLFQLMHIAIPLSLLITGPLVDNVLEPAVGSPAWAPVAPLVGSAPGAGMGLVMVLAGVTTFGMTLAVYLHPRTRHVERDLPDYAPVAATAV